MQGYVQGYQRDLCKDLCRVCIEIHVRDIEIARKLEAFDKGVFLGDTNVTGSRFSGL
jgi:hypothetical protein